VTGAESIPSLSEKKKNGGGEKKKGRMEGGLVPNGGGGREKGTKIWKKKEGARVGDKGIKGALRKQISITKSRRESRRRGKGTTDSSGGEGGGNRGGKYCVPPDARGPSHWCEKREGEGGQEDVAVTTERNYDKEKAVDSLR